MCLWLDIGPIWANISYAAYSYTLLDVISKPAV